MVLNHMYTHTYTHRYDTTTGKRISFAARPVIGGLMARMVVKNINTHMTKLKPLMDLDDILKL